VHRDDQRRAGAIVLERIRFDRIGHKPAVGERTDAAGRIAGDTLPQPGIVTARRATANINGAPLKRRGVRNRQSSSKPALLSKTGPTPKAWMRPTAPGKCATHSTTSMIQPMPSPISRQNTASNPSGKVSTPRMPTGMTQTETTSIARTLASTP
jgi:hypothetical protein